MIEDLLIVRFLEIFPSELQPLISGIIIGFALYGLAKTISNIVRLVDMI